VLQQRFHDEAREMRHVAHQHAQQVVHLAGERGAFNHLGPGLHGGSEGVHGTALVANGMFFQAHVDVGREPQAHVLWRHQRNIAGDDA